jgi:hypothetical protein
MGLLSYEFSMGRSVVGEKNESLKRRKIMLCAVAHPCNPSRDRHQEDHSAKC